MTTGRGEARRVGLFGLLGSGNIGNDISMQVILGYLRDSQPAAVIDAMCMGPERVRAEYGVGAIPLQWSRAHEDRVSGLPRKALKAVGKAVDILRTAAWVRRHDVVIVPGMGVLEATTPVNPWGFPFALLLLSVWGCVFGTKVALVSVGADAINQPAVRFVLNWAARLASYRSYRDERSRDAMRNRGLDVSRDRVFPDLVLALPPDEAGPGDPGTVAVGVMAYNGTNDDRARADDVHAAYTASVTGFVGWLLDTGRSVRLLTGDAVDAEAVAEVLAAVRTSHPGVTDDRLAAARMNTFSELAQAMSPAGFFVGTRYHNVVCALRLGKPTVSLGYSDKHVSLMEEMGLPQFCQHASTIDLDRLIEQFTELENSADDLRTLLRKRNEEASARAVSQFALLDARLFGPR